PPRALRYMCAARMARPRSDRRKAERRPMLARMRLVISALALVMLAGAAQGGTLGQPSPWEMTFQPSATPVMDFIAQVHFWILVIITAIMALVTVLLVYVMIRFNARSNPRPSRVTHNTVLEVVWTVIPVLVLVGIAIPSFRLLYDQLELPAGDLTVKAIGTA